jgi:hypothetical protein
MGAIFPVVVLLALASGAALFVLMRGDRTWLDEPAPEPPAPEVVEEVTEPGEVTRVGVQVDEPSVLSVPPEADVGEAEPADVFVLAPMDEPLPEPVAEPAQTRGRPRRRPRFEEVAELTVPDLVDAGPVTVAAVGAVPEKVPVHIPITTRLFGAVRLALLVAVSAAAVAAAVVGAGYVLMEKLLGGG